MHTKCIRLLSLLITISFFLLSPTLTHKSLSEQVDSSNECEICSKTPCVRYYGSDKSEIIIYCIESCNIKTKEWDKHSCWLDHSKPEGEEKGTNKWLIKVE